MDGAGPFVMGVVFGLLFVLMLMHLARVVGRLRRWPHAVATVQRLQERSDSDGTTTSAVYRFEDADGNGHSATTLVIFWAPKPGATLPVAYNPDEPGEHEIVSRGTMVGLFAAALVSGAVTVGLFVVGINGLVGGVG